MKQENRIMHEIMIQIAPLMKTKTVKLKFVIMYYWEIIFYCDIIIQDIICRLDFVNKCYLRC